MLEQVSIRARSISMSYIAPYLIDIGDLEALIPNTRSQQTVLFALQPFAETLGSKRILTQLLHDDIIIRR